MVGAARALTLAALAASLAATGPAAAQPLEPSVGCRDLLPNGAYLLRDAHGRLRVSGALARGRRTGTFIFWDERGSRTAVVPYDSDRIAGTVAFWYAPSPGADQGRRRLESRFSAGRREGVTRSWHEDGALRSDVVYERGELTAARAWRRDGAELSRDDARGEAARDAEADDAALAALAALVTDNEPVCTSDTPRE